tara:strand:- start:543 stop:809 length:267 start_codon:yes stop_codon:yes gene_type:complete
MDLLLPMLVVAVDQVLLVVIIVLQPKLVKVDRAVEEIQDLLLNPEVQVGLRVVMDLLQLVVAVVPVVLMLLLLHRWPRLEVKVEVVYV